MARLLFSLVVVSIAASADAQVFYEPLQYQYDSGGRSYYYGGSDAGVHASANALSRFSWWGRSQGYAFHSHRLDTHREVSNEPLRVYTDAAPHHNARFYGYTADDARNEAYQNAPRYFKKSEALKSAIRQEDGSLVVPAQPMARGNIVIRPWAPPAKSPAVEKSPRKEPQPILIIPKRLLDQPLWREALPQANAG